MTNNDLENKLKDLELPNLSSPKQKPLKELLLKAASVNLHQSNRFRMRSIFTKAVFGTAAITAALLLIILNSGKNQSVSIANAAQEATKQSISKVEAMTDEQRAALNGKLQLVGMDILDVLNAAKLNDNLKEISVDEAAKNDDQPTIAIVSGTPAEPGEKPANWITQIPKATSGDQFKEYVKDENLTLYFFSMNDGKGEKNIIFGLNPDHDPTFVKVIGAELPMN